MKGKRLCAVLLTGILVLPTPAVNVLAADFSDSVTEEKNSLEDLFTSGDSQEDSSKQAPGQISAEVPPIFTAGEETKIQETVVVQNVSYKYDGETDSYFVPAEAYSANLLNGTIALVDEADGKKVTKIQDKAFCNLPELKYLYIPSSVIQIEGEIFHTEASVTIYGKEGSAAQEYAAVHGLPFIAEGSQSQDQLVVQDGLVYLYEESGDGYSVTGYNEALPQELFIPETVNGKPVIKIEDSVFSQCSRLKKVTVPGTVTSIGECAFYMAANLEEAILQEGVQSLGSFVFAGCTSLRNAVLPDSVTQLGASGFQDCPSLENVRLSAGLKEICHYMFANSKLDNVLVIPEGVTELEWYVFSNFECEKVILPNTLTSIGDRAFIGGKMEEVIVPDSVTYWDIGVFTASDIDRIVLGNGLTSIRMNTFKNCKNMREFIIPDNFVEIGKYAFMNTGLYRLYIPASVKRIHKQAFAGSSHLTLFVEKGSYAEQFARENGIPYDTGDINDSVEYVDGIEYQYQPDEETYMLAYADEDLIGEIVIPSAIQGISVGGIKEGAFEKCTNTFSVTLPDCVTFIGDRAFKGSGLSRIILSPGTESIGEEAFAQSRLEEIILPGNIKEFGEKAFYNCTSLKSVSMEQGTAEIPRETFYGCSALERIALPEDLEIIGVRAFQGCGFTHIELPQGLSKVGWWAFAQCTALKEITIPGTINSLTSGVFKDCTSLEKVTLQDGILEIGDIFSGCEALRELHIPDSVYGIYGMAVNENCTVYGNTESTADQYCKEKGISFISVGESVLETPKITSSVYQDNGVHVELDSRCDNAQFYEYVISESPDFPENGSYLYKQEKSSRLSQDFLYLEKGTYYLFARSMRNLSDGSTQYSPWSEREEVIIAINTPDPSPVQSVKVKGNTVTVTVKKSAGTKGYGIVLADYVEKEGCQELVNPLYIRYASKNNRSTVYTFKNVRMGSYEVFARTYTRNDSGKNVYSRWSVFDKTIRVKR